MRERFEQAARALAGDGAAREALVDDLPRNLVRRQELCLEMEIAAGLDSPQQFSDARLRLQVSRLADALGHRQGGSTDAAGRLRELLLDWYLTGPVPLETRSGLDARIARVLTVAE